MAEAEAGGSGGGGGGGIDPTACATYNYDVINTGREVLAQVITIIEGNLTLAVNAMIDKPAVEAAAGLLLEAYADLDELLGAAAPENGAA
jgi:hypothetical protein